MRTIFIILQKEFIQVFRNKAMLPIIFVLPIIQLLILSNAATYEIKDIRLFVSDNDNSSTSRALIQKFSATKHFRLVAYMANYKSGLYKLDAGEADLVLSIPNGFERNLIRENKTQVQLSINAIDGAAAGLSNAYAVAILQDFNSKIRAQLTKTDVQEQGISTTFSYWFNPDLNYKTFMVPGILVLLVTMVALFLAGMNIVREKEIGTIEQLNVTPIGKGKFIIGKLLPFWILGMFELGFGLLLARVIFNVPVEGSVLLLFAFAAVYLLMILGMGFFISTFTNTQQQAMFIAWFFMVIFILMSGLFTPVESMPGWAQKLTLFNPVAYFIKVIRMVMLKGAGFSETAIYFLYISVFAVAANVLAVLNYRKTN